MQSIVKAGFAAAMLGIVGSANAQLVNLGPGSFTPLASVITFSEPSVPLGTVNPVYNFTGVPDLGNVTVSFAGSFVGQTITGSFPKTLSGTPTGPLTLGAGNTFTAQDGAVPTAPILSGDPLYNGPISVLFSQPVAAVGLSGGYFNAIGATTIQAFDANGVPLGSITNSQLGVEFYGLADASGNNVISGISFYITGDEPAGFDIDNLTFGSRRVIVNQTPEPGTMALLVSMGLSGAGMIARRRRK